MGRFLSASPYRSVLLAIGLYVVAASWSAFPEARADTFELALVKSITPADDLRVRRNFRHTSRTLQPGPAILIEGSPAQIRRLSDWLDDIARTPIGRETLDAIYASGNTLTLRHSEWALVASGRTHAPVTTRLTDGRGADVVILFDARIPDSGSHVVFDRARRPIPFSAQQNLFHELSHARHLTNGTWRYFDSEGQAIEEENVFRREWSALQGQEAPLLRVGQRGRQLWWPERPVDTSADARDASVTAEPGISNLVQFPVSR